jgi:hypothetical protein
MSADHKHPRASDGSLGRPSASPDPGPPPAPPPRASDPYLGVYTATPSPVSTVCLSTSSSAYTVDSRCELLTNRSEHHAHPLAALGQRQNVERPVWGFGNYRPGFLQPCANIKMFIFHCCVFSTVSGALIAGYVNSVITTIEKRFEIGSSHSGLIPASVEFGSLLAVLFVSYFGGSRNIPLWIGCGALLQGLGAITFTLPHFLSQSYTVTGGLTSNFSGDNMCQAPPEDHSGMGELRGGTQGDYCADQHLTLGGADSGGSYNNIELNIFILIAAQAMIGIGGAPLFTLGTTYIDDHVPKEKAPAFIGEWILYFVYVPGIGSLRNSDT